MNHLLFFSEAEPNPQFLGGKGSNIVRLARLGANVPPGFIVTTSAYNLFLKESGRKDQLAKLLSGHPEPKEVVNLSRSIRKLIFESEFPEGIKGEIKVAFDKLSKECGADASFAVRSSATIEDTSNFSFAGQSDTYLNNTSYREVLSSVRNCWASLFSLQALSYFTQMTRMNRDSQLSDLQMGVVVQKMVDSQISGVLFTANVMNNNRNQAMINSTWGLGETIANNSVIPDMIILQKDDHKILRMILGKKEKMSIRNPRGIGTILIDTDPKLRAEYSLDKSQIKELSKLGVQLEKAFGSAQDVEWAIENGKIYVLQSRPITTLEANG